MPETQMHLNNTYTTPMRCATRIIKTSQIIKKLLRQLIFKPPGVLQGVAETHKIKNIRTIKTQMMNQGQQSSQTAQISCKYPISKSPGVFHKLTRNRKNNEIRSSKNIQDTEV